MCVCACVHVCVRHTKTKTYITRQIETQSNRHPEFLRAKIHTHTQKEIHRDAERDAKAHKIIDFLELKFKGVYFSV